MSQFPYKRELNASELLYLRSERKRLIKQSKVSTGKKSEKIGQKRAAIDKSRKIFRKLAKSNSRTPLPKEYLISSFRKSRLADKLHTDRKNQWIPMLRRVFRDNVPSLQIKNFSLNENPSGVFEQICSMIEIESTELRSHLHFDDKYCYDIASYLLLSEIWQDFAPIFEGGRMSAPIAKVLSAVGLKERLRIQTQEQRNIKDIWAMPVQRRRPSNSSHSLSRNIEPQSREITCDRVCDQINSWLGVPEISQELSQDGIGWISNIIGELLDNAERHGEPDTKDGDWSITAFMARRQATDDQPAVYRCHFAFMSIGASIPESLTTCSTTTRRKIDEYVARHVNAPHLTRDVLETICALQDGITRDQGAEQDGRGGTGLLDVLELVTDLAGSEQQGAPRVTIISGSACIFAKAPYLSGLKHRDGASPRNLWFNQSNHPNHPPDENHVTNLGVNFPGTIISVTFNLDPDYLNETVNAGD